MRTALRVALLAVACTACAEHATTTLTPAQKKKVEAAMLDAPAAAAVKPHRALNANIEDQVRLIGVDIDKTEVSPGQSLTVTYYVEALADPMGDNNVFVHFQGKKNDRKAWMNLDHHLVEGLLPLRQLKKGQIVKDVQKVTVSPDFSAGEAKIYWGLWRGEYRLKIKNAGEVPHDEDGRVIVATVNVKGGRPALPQATALRLKAGEAVTVDGKLDEAFWATAQWTPAFTAPSGSGETVPTTRAAFFWTPDMLYVGVESADEDVWTSFKDRDSDTWKEEVIELFIDADGDQKDYLELQVTPANVIFDARFPTHRSDLTAARTWNMNGLVTGAHVDGTLNNRDDQDKAFTIEMGIPVAEVPGAPHVPAAANDVWRVNLFRWDFPKGGKQVAGAFSPPIVPDFHAMDKAGRLRLVDPAAAPAVPSAPSTAGSAPAPSAPSTAGSAPAPSDPSTAGSAPAPTSGAPSAGPTAAPASAKVP